MGWLELGVNDHTHSRADIGQVLGMRWEGGREKWPRMMRPEHGIVHIRIEDADPADYQKYLDPLFNIYTVKLIPPTVARYRITVPPFIVTEFGADKGVSHKVRNYLTNFLGAVLVGSADDPSNVVFTIKDTTAALLARDLNDKFQDYVHKHRFSMHKDDVLAAKAESNGRIIRSDSYVKGRAKDRVYGERNE